MCNRIQVVLGYILGIPTIPNMYPTFPGIPTTVYVFSNLASLKNHVTKLMVRTVLDVKATKEKVTRRYCRSQHVKLERGVWWYYKMAATILPDLTCSELINGVKLVSFPGSPLTLTKCEYIYFFIRARGKPG